jgi:anthranilate phosphoribosyltransferase
MVWSGFMNSDTESWDAKEVLLALFEGKHLDTPTTTDLFEAMMAGTIESTQIAAVLTILALRGPETEELAAAAGVMRSHVTPIPTAVDPNSIVDTAGTGGAPKTFNVSTAAAIVAAGAGIPVAKHGNRSRTGRGSAEVLADLGVDIDALPETQGRCLEEAGICFCFAIHHHPATKHVVPIRRSLGFPTIFNLLGPLTNPAAATRQLLGVWDHRYGERVALALRSLGSQRALVAHSQDGLDEISISAPTTIWQLVGDRVEEQILRPEDVGLKTHPIETVTARDLDHATVLIRSVLDGTEKGPPLDMVLINAAAAVLASGTVESLAEGVERSREAIESGAAMSSLSRLCEVSQEG